MVQSQLLSPGTSRCAYVPSGFTAFQPIIIVFEDFLTNGTRILQFLSLSWWIAGKDERREMSLLRGLTFVPTDGDGGDAPVGPPLYTRVCDVIPLLIGTGTIWYQGRNEKKSAKKIKHKRHKSKKKKHGKERRERRYSSSSDTSASGDEAEPAVPSALPRDEWMSMVRSDIFEFCQRHHTH